MEGTLSATLEDYLGVILKFQLEKKYARVSDIALDTGVAKSAVTAALQSLSSKGLVNYQPYEPATLTEAGEKLAREMALRHRVLMDFLTEILAIDSGEAENIACDMEHSIGSRALERLVCFLAFVGTRPSRENSWLKEFRSFTEEGAGGRTCGQLVKQYLGKTSQELVQ